MARRVGQAMLDEGAQGADAVLFFGNAHKLCRLCAAPRRSLPAGRSAAAAAAGGPPPPSAARDHDPGGARAGLKFLTEVCAPGRRLARVSGGAGFRRRGFQAMAAA